MSETKLAELERRVARLESWAEWDEIMTEGNRGLRKIAPLRLLSCYIALGIVTSIIYTGVMFPTDVTKRHLDAWQMTVLAVAGAASALLWPVCLADAAFSTVRKMGA